MDFIERSIEKSLEKKSEAEDELMGEQKEEKKAERLKEPMGGKILVCEKVFGGFNIGDTIKTRSNNKGFSIKLFNSQEGRLVKGENWITVDVGDDFEDFSNSFIFREEEKSESVLDEEVVKEKLKEEISDKTVGGENQPELKKETMGQEEFAEEELTPEIEIEDEEKKEQAELEPELKKEMPEQKEVVEEKGREELEQKLLQVDKLLSLYKDRGRFLFHLKNLKESDANENEIAVAQTKVSEINYNIKGLYNKITESDIKGFPENEKRKIEEIMLAVEEGKMDYGKLAVRENEEKESRVLLEINKNLDRIKREVQNLDYRNDENRKMTENFIKELEEYKELTEVTLKIEGLGIVESANCVQLTKSITETIDEIKNKLEIEPEPETPETPEIKTEEEKRHEAEDLAYKKTAKESSDKMRHRVTRIGEKIADNQEMSSENREKIEKERSMETISSIMFDLNRDSYEEDPEKRRKLFEAVASAMKVALFEQKTICKRKESELAEARKEAVEKFGIASEGEIIRVVSKKDSQKTKESKKGGFWSGIKERMGTGNKEKTEEEKSENSELKKAVAAKILEIEKIENRNQLPELFLFKGKKGEKEKLKKIGVIDDYVERIIDGLPDELKEKGGIEKIIKELEFDREYFEGVMREEGDLDKDKDTGEKGESSAERPKSMNMYALSGHKVVITQEMVDNMSKEEKEKIKNLEIGKVYTVEKTIVDDSHTDVLLKEIPNKEFNAGSFNDIEKQDPELDKQHPDWARYNQTETLADEYKKEREEDDKTQDMDVFKKRIRELEGTKEGVVLAALSILNNDTLEKIKNRIKKGGILANGIKISSLKEKDPQMYEEYIEKMKKNLSNEEIKILENAKIGDIKKGIKLVDEILIEILEKGLEK